MMYSEGFEHAKLLAAKLVSVFQLSRQLLSPQQHYDWGLRALKTILSSSGQMLASEKKSAGTLKLGVDAASATAEAGYDAASDAGAQLDAALTQDAKVRTSDGELVGTVNKADLADDMVLVDLDTQMETSVDGSTEHVAVSKNNMSVGNDGLVVNMSEQSLIAAINAQAAATATDG